MAVRVRQHAAGLFPHLYKEHSDLILRDQVDLRVDNFHCLALMLFSKYLQFEALWFSDPYSQQK